MAKSKSGVAALETMSVRELEALLKATRTADARRAKDKAREEIADLRGRRKELTAKLKLVEKLLAILSGRPGGKRRGRKAGRNTMKIRDKILAIVKEAAEPVRARDIAAELSAQGLDVGRQIGSHLSAMRKNGLLAAAGRGMYKLP